jgi:flagellar biosynthesis/type III secretory pathway protein FliH
MESRLPVRDLLLETIRLEKKIKDENIKNKVIALTMVMANRLVEAELLEKIWEEVKMLKILKYAEDKGKEQGFQIGIEQGIKQGIEQGIEKGLEKGRLYEKRNLIERLLIKKFGPLPRETQNKIQSMDDVVLDILSLEILDFQSIDDLFRFVEKMAP